MNSSPDHRVILKAACGGTAPLRVTVNKRARRILLRIDSKQREAVAVAPSAKHVKQAMSFAEERIEWIVDRLANLPQAGGLDIGDSVLFRGQPHKIVPATSGRGVRIEGGEEGSVIAAPGRADLIPSKIIGFLRANARADLTARVGVHAEKLQVQPSGIAIKDTRSRWGSCSSAGNLNFSWRLICAPPEILDYVAAHEVSHLREMNHSKRFWMHVETCCPDFQSARKWLNEHGRSLHAVGA